MTEEKKTSVRLAAPKPPPEPVAHGVYIAKEALYVDGARAFAAGDFVPAEHINRFGWQDKVREFDDNEGED